MCACSISRVSGKYLVFLALLVVNFLPAASNLPQDTQANGTWLVHIAPGADPVEVAESLGAVYVGPLRGVEQYHRIRFASQLKSRSDETADRQSVVRQLESSRDVLEYEEDLLLERFPRTFEPNDPLFFDQWHLENAGQSGGIPFSDTRVRPAWNAGLSGEDVVIGVVDEGIQFRHPDLLSNWLPGLGYDYNDEDADPSPSDNEDRHGTAVAGISLAAANTIGGLGIAYNANLVPLRLIAGPFRVGQEAEALSYKRDIVDIYNNSWGPSDDDGVQYASISQALKNAFASNVRNGRNGLGNIYVWAAGNGGLNGDNSNYDGYNASPYTISVGAIGHDDIKAGYSEPGANLLVVAPSGGRGAGITTTDNTGVSGYQDDDYYDNFSGTSAAAPMVSGIAALLLEHRPDFSWRDVQEVLALSASPVDFSDEKWSRNGAGHWVSHDYGFGRVDTEAAIRLASDWPVLGPLQQFVRSATGSFPVALPEGVLVEQELFVSTDTQIQLVLLNLSANHSDWGDLQIELVSPSGTVSKLAEPHANANSPGEPGSWSYLTTHCLGESSAGPWKLRITDAGTGGSGSLLRWSLSFFGTDRVGQVNQAPVFEDLQVESASYPIEINVLEGVTDPDGDVPNILSTQMPRVSNLENLGNGRYRFTMGETKFGTDMFSVLIGDGRGMVRRRLVNVLDPRPVGRNDLYPVAAGFSGDLPVTSNDFDPDGDTLRLTGITGSYTGQASLNGSGSIQYTAPDGWTGLERIQYFITDDSDGESSGWATVVVQESPDMAIQFDGEDDYLIMEDAPGIPTTDQFTAEAWIYPTSYGEYVTGFGRIYDRDTFVFFLTGFDHLYYNDRSLVAYFLLQDGRSVAANTPDGSIRLDTWQHVAISYDSADRDNPVRMYIDGLPVSVRYPLPGTTAPDQPISSNGQSPLYIGESDSGARAFAGKMTEFRIWNSVLDPQVIARDHDRRLEGTEAGLSFYLPLDRKLTPEAVNVGEAMGSADIFEAERVPTESPWKELGNHYTLLQDSGSGWWLERTLGWIYGDLYPWIYLPSLNWAYTGHPSESTHYLLWPLSPGWGWLLTEPALYPWFYRYDGGDWIWYLTTSSMPPWFYSSGMNLWFPGNSDFPTL